LEDLFLKDTRYAKFINKNLLDKYYPVGGVRIEDDILVTKNGYENLTTAPKGDEALKIINEGKEGIVEEKQKKGWFW
jgi:Xaa-Pro dipeptidase